MGRKRTTQKSLRRGLIEEIYNSAPMPQPAQPDYSPSFNSGMSRDEIANIYNSYTPETQEIPTLKPNTTPTTPSISDELERMKKAKADTTTPRTEGEQKAIDTYYDSLMKASGQAPTTTIPTNTPSVDYRAEIERMNAIKADTTTPRTEGENKAIETYLNSLVDAQRYLDSQKPITKPSVKTSSSEKKVTQKNVKNIGTVEIKADGTKNYTKTMSPNEQRDYERALLAQSKARGRALSPNEQRDLERAQNAIAQAKEREKVTEESVNKVMPTSARENTEELQFGQLRQKPKAAPTPKSMGVDYYNNLIAMGKEDIAQEYKSDVQKSYQKKQERANEYRDAHKPVYDERGFETTQSVVNRYLDPNKKLTKDEEKYAKKLIDDYEKSDLGQKNENAYTLVFDDARPDGMSVPYYTVDENGNYDPSKELTPEERQFRQSMGLLKTKVSDSESSLIGASQAIPGVDALMKAGDTDGSYADMVTNAQRQNPIPYLTGLFGTGVALNAAGQGLLKGTKYGETISKLAGANGASASAGRKILADALMDAPVDVALDIIPSLTSDIASDQSTGQVVKNALLNTALNAGLNLGAATLGNLDELRPRGITTPNVSNELNPLEMAARNADIEDAINQQREAIRQIETLRNNAPRISMNDIDSQEQAILDQMAKYRRGEMPTNELINMGETQRYLSDFGNVDNDVLLKQSKFKQLTSPFDKKKHQHGLSDEEVAGYVRDANSPIAVYASPSDPTSPVIVGNRIDANGNPIVSSLNMDVPLGRETNNLLSSEYRKNVGDQLYHAREEGRMKFENREKVDELISDRRHRAPKSDSSFDLLSNSNVNQLDDSVNPSKITNNNVNPDDDDFPPIPPSGGGGSPVIPNGGNSGSGGNVVPRGKVSQFATNSMKHGTNLTPEEYKANVDLKDFVYQDKTEKQSMADAFNMIQSEGVDNLKARLLADDATSLTQSEIDALMSLTRTNNATARAMEAVGEDASALRAETNAIYKKLRAESTSNAQALQALAKWTRNTPEGLLMSAENIVNGNTEVKGSKLQEMLKKLNRYQKNYEFSPDFEKRFLTEAEKLEGISDVDSREAKDIMARLGRMVNDEIPVKLNEKVQSFLMDNMLGNFRTLITRNAGGNVGLAGVEQLATRPLAAGIDRLVSAATGKRTQAGLTREGLTEYIQGFRKGLSDELHDVKTGLHTARTGENTLEEAIRSNRHVFKNKIQDKFDSLVKNGLSVGDRPFYEANYKQTLGDYYRLRDMGAMGEAVQSLSDADFKTYAETAAKLNALASVYQNDSQISNALLGFKKAIGEFSEGTVGFDILSQFSMPFVKTPANVVDRAIDYSPLGIVRNTARTIKEGGIKGANFDQNRFVNETARNILGTGLMAGAGALAKNGVISSAYSDDKNIKQAQKDSGMQEYALNIPGNMQMDIGWLPVVGSNAVAAAAAVDAFRNGEGGIGENLSKGLTAGGEALFDQSMFQGLQRLFGSGDSYDSDSTLPENMMNVVKSGFGQAIPSLLRQSAQVKDKYARDLGYSNKDLSFGIMDNYDINSLINNIPVLREYALAPKVDLSGNLVEENQGRGLGSKILEDMILPGKLTEVNVNPLDEEAIRLSESTGNEDAYRPKAYLKDITLSNDELVKYEQRFGSEITSIGNQIMNSDFYQASDDLGKEKILDDAYDAIKAGVNSEYNGKNVTGAAKEYVKAGGGEEGIKAVLEYESNKYNPYGLSSDYYKKATESNEDLSKYEGYKDALSSLGIEDNKTFREAYVNGGVEALEKAQQANEYAKEAGTTISSGSGKMIQEAIESGDTQKAEEIVETSKTLADYGLDKPAPTATYTKAQEVIPSLTMESFVKTYKAIDSDNSQGIKQDEIINYLNRGNYSQSQGDQIWKAYGNGDWKKIPKLEDGTWKKKNK